MVCKCETLNKINGSADIHRNNKVDKLNKLLCGIDWKEVIASRDGNLVICFKKFDNNCDVDFFLLYKYYLVFREKERRLFMAAILLTISIISFEYLLILYFVIFDKLFEK